MNGGAAIRACAGVGPELLEQSGRADSEIVGVRAGRRMGAYCSILCLYCGTQVDHVIGVGGVHFFEVDGLSLTLEGEAGRCSPCTEELGWDGWHPLRRNRVESHAAVRGHQHAARL